MLIGVNLTSRRFHLKLTPMSNVPYQRICIIIYESETVLGVA